jgi:hypothetical protein
MTLVVPPWAAAVATELPYPLVFATVSGAHLYGFASIDSDLDLRGAHVLPAADVLGPHCTRPWSWSPARCTTRFSNSHRIS